MESIVYKPIGYVKSPYTSREDMPRFYTDSGEVTQSWNYNLSYRGGQSRWNCNRVYRC